MGQGYNFSWQNTNHDHLFNGNNISNNKEFDNYLKRLGYKFKNENFDFGGYFILKNKKITLIMDTGNPPASQFTKDYQAGPLSFEIISNQKKEEELIKNKKPKVTDDTKNLVSNLIKNRKKEDIEKKRRR